MESITAVLRNLWELQELDRQIQVLRACAPPPSSHKAGHEELSRIQSLEQEKKQGLESLRLFRNQAKSALEACRQRLMKCEAAMKGIKSVSVLEGTIAEIEKLKTLERDLEFKESSVEKEAEAFQTQISDLQSRRAAIEAAQGQAATVIQAKDGSTEATLLGIEERKSKVIAKIPVSYISLYQRLFSARRGIVMAGVRGNTCGACNMILPVQFVTGLSKSRAIDQCPSCKRILLAAGA